MGKTRIAFLGTPDFAVEPLKTLVRSSFIVDPVITRPDRPRGRGRNLRPTPVKEVALRLGLRVESPASGGRLLELLQKIRPDLLVTVAYGRILPEEALAAARIAAINLHASLLPRWRGAAPIQRALMAGDRTTGVTTIHMAREVDAGDIIYQEEVAIEDGDNAGSLHDRLAAVGAELLLRTVRDLCRGVAPRIPQDPALVTYAPPIRREEEIIDWSWPADRVWNLVRGLSPDPGATAYLEGKILKILRARPVDGRGRPGQVVAVGGESFTVACGSGALEVLELKPAGKKAMSAGAFLNGYRLEPSNCFETAGRGKANEHD